MHVLPHFLLWSLRLRPAQTQTSDGERACLSKHARGRRRLAEIGVWHGVTTCVLRRAMAPDGLIHAIDPFPRGRLGLSLHQFIAHREVSRVANGHVAWMRMTGANAATVCDEPVDFVFIDGDHSYAGLQEDWHAWSRLVAEGGVVALHDCRVCPGRPIDDAGSVRFANEVILRDPHFAVIDEVDSLIVLQRLPTSSGRDRH